MARGQGIRRPVRIKWNVDKDKTNRRKHRVSFALASKIFLDPPVATVVDERHPSEEMRFFSVGVTKAGRRLSVGHTDDGETLRLITARIRRGERGRDMKNVDEDEMPADIDFSNATRGKYASRLAQRATMILLEPDVAEEFPDSVAVNAALRLGSASWCHRGGWRDTGAAQVQVTRGRVGT